MIWNLKLLLTLQFFCWTFFAGAATTIRDTIKIKTDGKDAYVHSGYPSSNYGTRTSDSVFWTNGSPGQANRTFIYADLSGIPTNAIIISATLKLYAAGVNNSGNHPMYVSRVLSSWTETGITWSNQPAVTTTDQVSVSHASTSSTGWQAMDLRVLAQYSVNLPTQNFGWRIAVQSESGSRPLGVQYLSGEASMYDPYLAIEYVLPIEITGTVKHCSSGSDNGEISVSVTEGSSTYSNYSWYHYDMGTVSMIQTGTNMATSDVDSLEDGLYMITVTDDAGSTGYQYFLVGEYGATTSVQFRNNSSTANSILFNDDANLKKDAASGYYFGASNTSLYAYRSSTEYYSSVLKYRVDFDSLFVVENAALSLISEGHYRNSSPATTDSGYVSRITSNWYESFVTYDTKPTVNTYDRLVINETSPAGAVTRNDTINIRAFVDYWQENPEQNYGIDISLKKYVQSANAYLRYYSYDNTTSANRPCFHFSYSLPDQVVSQYFDSTGLGNIVITVPDGELPYTYLISYDTIPDLSDLWDNVKDSVQVDSLDFFEGKTNSLQYTFNDLPAERYFVAVFDNNGDKIFDDEVILTTTTEILNDITLDNDSLKVELGQTSGSGTLNAIIGKTESGGFDFKVLQLGDIVVGFNYQSDLAARATEDFEYSIELDSSARTFFMMKSDSVIFSDTLMLNDIFRIEKENYEFVIYRNEFEMHRHKMSEMPVEGFKLDIVFKTQVGLLTKPVLVGKIAKAKPIKSIVSQTECGLDNGSIKMQFNTAMYSSVTGGTYTIKDASSGATIESGTFSYPSSITEYLTVGNYKVIYTTTGSPATTWTEYFTIGQPVIWDFLNDYYTPVGSTITTNSMTYSANAISQNILQEEVTEGFVTFKLGTKHYYSTWGAPYMFVGACNSTMRIVESDLDQVIRLKAYSLGTNIITKYIEVYNGNDSLVNTPFSINTEGPFKIQLYNDTLKTYYNNSPTSFAFVPQGTPDDYRVLATSFCGYIKDPYVDFCYGSSTSELCAELDYELNGNFYVTNNGYFCFIFNQEYNDSTITFNVYNRSNVIVATQNDFDLEEMIFGENRVVLDLTNTNFCLGKGYFVLEVINGKGEKFYLRFYNNYSGCMAVEEASSSAFTLE